jgi:hypothetical protein
MGLESTQKWTEESITIHDTSPRQSVHRRFPDMRWVTSILPCKAHTKAHKNQSTTERPNDTATFRQTFWIWGSISLKCSLFAYGTLICLHRCALMGKQHFRSWGRISQSLSSVRMILLPTWIVQNNKRALFQFVLDVKLQYRRVRKWWRALQMDCTAKMPDTRGGERLGEGGYDTQYK